MRNQIGPERVRHESPEDETLCARSHAPGQHFELVFGARGMEKYSKIVDVYDFLENPPGRIFPHHPALKRKSAWDGSRFCLSCLLLRAGPQMSMLLNFAGTCKKCKIWVAFLGVPVSIVREYITIGKPKEN